MSPINRKNVFLWFSWFLTTWCIIKSWNHLAQSYWLRFSQKRWVKTGPSCEWKPSLGTIKVIGLTLMDAHTTVKTNGITCLFISRECVWVWAMWRMGTDMLACWTISLYIHSLIHSFIVCQSLCLFSWLSSLWSLSQRLSLLFEAVSEH